VGGPPTLRVHLVLERVQMEAVILSDIYILERGQLSTVLAPDSDGVPTVCAPQPFITRFEYLSVGFEEGQIIAARERLNNPQCGLLVAVMCPDGPPNRSALIFAFQQQLNGISWRDGSRSYHGGSARRFAATTPQVNWAWTEEAKSGRAGYFLTGQSGESALWRIFRLEANALNCTVVTLAPVRLNARCPAADFSSISEPALRSELAQQYEEFCRSATAYAFRDVATKARNIAEGLLAYRLRSTNVGGTGRIWNDLQTVKKILEDTSTRASSPVSELEYHLIHKIRLVHARTHPDNPAAASLPVRPEFAMSVVEDLSEILRGWGLARA
jgi:hypothetical protein